MRSQSEFTKKETEVFLQYVQDYRLERQLTALYNRLMGVSALTDQPPLLEELILSRKPKRWELSEFCVKVSERVLLVVEGWCMEWGVSVINSFPCRGSLKFHFLLFYFHYTQACTPEVTQQSYAQTHTHI